MLLDPCVRKSITIIFLIKFTSHYLERDNFYWNYEVIRSEFKLNMILIGFSTGDLLYKFLTLKL